MELVPYLTPAWAPGEQDYHHQDQLHGVKQGKYKIHDSDHHKLNEDVFTVIPLLISEIHSLFWHNTDSQGSREHEGEQVDHSTELEKLPDRTLLHEGVAEVAAVRAALFVLLLLWIAPEGACMVVVGPTIPVSTRSSQRENRGFLIEGHS